MRLGIRNAEFWSNPWRTRKTVQKALSLDDDPACLIDAPERVDLHKRKTLPVVLLRVRNLADREIGFQRHAIISAMNLNNDMLFVKRVFRRPVDGREAEGLNGLVAEGHTVDLRVRHGIPWIRGDYRVSLICCERLSEPRTIRLVDSEGYDDPEVDAFLASKLETPKISAMPYDPIPSYEENSGSPGIPEDTGIAIDVPRVTLVGSGRTSCILSGSFRLPLLPHHYMDEGDYTAVVPITLLLTGSVTVGPRLIPMGVPTRTYQKAQGSGYFTIDLCRLADLTTTPQTWFLYAFAGSVIEGPVPLAFARAP